MAVVSKTTEYWDGKVLLEAFFAYDDAYTEPRPVVLINHTWAGRDQFVDDKAKKIAELGYVGFAVDMYGKGVMGSNAEQNAKLMQPFIDDRAMLQQRMKAALTAARQLPCVDETQCAAIGFCFGGLCVLDLARTGIDLQGVVSFHGLLGAPGNTQGNIIKAKVLALHGHDDPMGPVEQVVAFEQEMTEAEADWQLHVYGQTMHAFTNPKANDPQFGTVYQPVADSRSWKSLQNFLAELFG
ncbi:MAG: dienelactone hydrolase family protein [Methylococcaceae bacterium]|nr:dienelactone hydrolase family protein [Methylococcaceae bacterium]